MLRQICTALAAFALLGATVPLDNGTQPTIEIGEGIIKSHLADPYSVHFVWPYEFSPGPFKWPLSKTLGGWFTCGRYNAKNSFGGYSGERWFFLLIRDGKEAFLVLDDPSFASAGAESKCAELIKNGRLHTLPIEVRNDPK